MNSHSKVRRWGSIAALLLAIPTIGVGLATQSRAQDEPPTEQVEPADEAKIEVEKTVDDKKIQRRLAAIFDTLAELSDSAYGDVQIEVRNGVVQVRGHVSSSTMAEKVEQKIANTEGVIFVENRLEVDHNVDLDDTYQTVGDSLWTLWRDFLTRLPLLVAAAIAIVITALVAKLAGWVLSRTLAKRNRIRYSLKDLIYQLTNLSVWVVGLLVAAVIAFPGMTPSKALTVLGLGSVAIGFAFKDIFENFFAGVLILWKYPFDRGDFIRCGDILGCVEEITIRNSLIRQLDGDLAVVPNAVLFKETVDVLTDQKHRRVRLVCGVAYDENVDQARDVIAKSVSSCVTVEGDRKPEVYACEFADSSVNFEIVWWTGSRPGELRRSRDEVITAIKRGLDDAGIEIPFPYRTLTFKDPVSVSNV